MFKQFDHSFLKKGCSGSLWQKDICSKRSCAKSSVLLPSSASVGSTPGASASQGCLLSLQSCPGHPAPCAGSPQPCQRGQRGPKAPVKGGCCREPGVAGRSGASKDMACTRLMQTQEGLVRGEVMYNLPSPPSRLWKQ